MHRFMMATVSCLCLLLLLCPKTAFTDGEMFEGIELETPQTVRVTCPRVKTAIIRSQCDTAPWQGAAEGEL